ncbi:hypothetical protein O3G_MSEX010832 [Manduca sexta]|uniref:Reverse transcriptase domain-containing protein n=1 Tax=Manduca sexta TaxID=7130 RepID=A0A921ZIW9_MANSE|nr:hypothetical protein O3G_MSEX010832 [Manduca sexta]
MKPLIRPHIIEQQHGFLSKKSTETNLCEFIDFITNAMDDRCQVDVVYTDYSKAFDRIHHDILVSKLYHFGIHGDLLRWVDSYLRDRCQAVTVKGFSSTFTPVPSGVPQGSHLGPLLFNIFVNDVGEIFKNTDFSLYADDQKIYKIVKTLDDCLLLQEDLEKLSIYCKANQLYLNTDKCNIITYSRKKNIHYDYSINDKVLQRVTLKKDLGIYLDSKLMFDSHITEVVNKAYKMLGFILRVSQDFKSISTVQLLYNCFVRSHLEYASVVWNPHYKIYIERLERIQEKFLKNLEYRFNYKKLPQLPRIMSLANRREIRDQVFLFKIVNNLIDSSYLLSRLSFRCPRVNSREKKVFQPSTSKTNYGSNTFVRRASNIHNMQFSDIDMFFISMNSFKRYIIESLCGN